MGTWKAVFTICLLTMAAAGAAERTREGGNRADVFVPIPVEREAIQPHGLAAWQSSASYHLATDCAAGAWRWAEPRESHTIEFPIATALIFRIERDSGTASAGPEEAAAFAIAAEEITTLFRIPAQDEVLDVARARLAVDPDSGATHPAARAKVRMILRWETFLERTISEAAAVLTATVAEIGYAPLRLTVTVGREHARMECAAVEVCRSGSWTPGGHRTETVQRQPLAPAFFGPDLLTISDPAAAEVTARGTMRLIGDWLRAHYVEGAATDALLTNTSNACAIAANLTPPDDSPRRPMLSER